MVQLKEYISKRVRDEENYIVKLYHNTDFYGLNQIIDNGFMDRKAYHKGECKDDVIWFTAGEDFGNACQISIMAPNQKFEDGTFMWMNDSWVTTRKNVFIDTYGFRIEKIGNYLLDNLVKRVDLSDPNGLADLLEYIMEASDNEIRTDEEFINFIGKQYSCERTVREFFGEDYYLDESAKLAESILQKIKELA